MIDCTICGEWINVSDTIRHTEDGPVHERCCYEVKVPDSYEFADINDFVFDVEVTFEEMQGALLGMATELERREILYDRKLLDAEINARLWIGGLAILATALLLAGLALVR